MTRARVVIENITPQVDGGRFAVKRVRGDTVSVGADVFTDGHDLVGCAVAFRRRGEPEWQRVAMKSAGNDRFGAQFTVAELGRYEFTVEAWVDHLATLKRDIAKKRAAGQDTSVEEIRVAELERSGVDPAFVVRHEPPLPVEVERELARFSSWYELFPRSAAGKPGKHINFFMFGVLENLNFVEPDPDELVFREYVFQTADILGFVEADQFHPRLTEILLQIICIGFFYLNHLADDDKCIIAEHFLKIIEIFPVV